MVADGGWADESMGCKLHGHAWERHFLVFRSCFCGTMQVWLLGWEDI